MTMKLTETRLNALLETLNAIICEEGMLTRTQRENMVLTVATIGSLNERLRQNSTIKESKIKDNKEKKPRIIDPLFPRAGTPWTMEEAEIIHEIIDGLPDDEIDNHVLWLSGQLGRTPSAIAARIVSEGRLDEDWAKSYRAAANELRAVVPEVQN